VETIAQAFFKKGVIPQNFLFVTRKRNERKFMRNPIWSLLLKQPNWIPDKIAFFSPEGSKKAIFPE
jgi:hypothetical protein